MTKEELIADKIKQLYRQAPSFEHLPDTLNECLGILVDRGKRHNGSTMGPSDYIFEDGDREAYYRASDPFKRLRNAVDVYGKEVPDEHADDLIKDCINYLVMWLNCRKQRGPTGIQTCAECGMAIGKKQKIHTHTTSGGETIYHADCYKMMMKSRPQIRRGPLKPHTPQPYNPVTGNVEK